jgi:hypothetical protein
MKCKGGLIKERKAVGRSTAFLAGKGARIHFLIVFTAKSVPLVLAFIFVMIV